MNQISAIFERDARDPENESGSLSAHEIEPSELHPQRFKFQFNHNQQLDGRSRLIASALVYSDSQFQKEYELIENPVPNSAQNFLQTSTDNFQKEVSHFLQLKPVYSAN